MPAVIEQGQVLGIQIQEEGDKVSIEGPQRIVNQNLDVNIWADYAVVIDRASGKVLYNKNSNVVHPIASMTKLMTALVFLDTNPDLSEVIKIDMLDLAGAGRMNISVGEEVGLDDLFHLSLIASDNSATLALVRSTGMDQDEFVEQMNIKARGLGLLNTSFADPVGLSAHNVSTAYEVAQMLDLATHHSVIKKILPLKNYSFTSQSGNYHRVVSTDHLLGSYLNVLGGKTGYTDEAGNCFTSLIKLENGHEIISAVLNSATTDSRFQDTKAIVDFVSENYSWE